MIGRVRWIIGKIRVKLQGGCKLAAGLLQVDYACALDSGCRPLLVGCERTLQDLGQEDSIPGRDRPKAVVELWRYPERKRYDTVCPPERSAVDSRGHMSKRIRTWLDGRILVRFRQSEWNRLWRGKVQTRLFGRWRRTETAALELGEICHISRSCRLVPEAVHQRVRLGERTGFP